MKEEEKSIRCFTEKEWQFYQTGFFGEADRTAMEEHLLTCDSCMACYLDIVEENLGKEPLVSLEENFTDLVMETIELENRSLPEVLSREAACAGSGKNHGSKANLLITYCAAASIALFFWIGGYFDGLSGSLSKGVDFIAETEITAKKTEPSQGFIQTGWTQKILDEKRPSFIKNLISIKEQIYEKKE